MKKIKGKAILIGGTIIAGLAGVFGVIKVLNEEQEMGIAVPMYGVVSGVSTFNSKFTSYEGTITGSMVRQLIEVVNASNVQNAGTDLIITITGTSVGGGTDGTFAFTGGTARKYNVKLTYTNEIVSSITIKETVNKNNEITNSLN